MGRVFKPYYTHRKTREKVFVANWYAEWQGADGKTKRRMVGRDKRAAEAFLVKMQDAVDRQRAGLDPAPTADARSTPLDALMAEYLEVLAARGTKPKYRRTVSDHLAAILAGCRWLLWSDIERDDLVRYLGKKRESGTGPATLNGYIRSAKGFTGWLAERFGTRSPLRKLAPFPEDVDRRRSKRILTDSEFAQLLVATEKCPRRQTSAFAPVDRAWLYRVAACTGIRASELASLTPESFRLDTSPPVVVVEAADAKGKREEPIPIPGHLLESLRPWLAKKPAKRRLWPGRWAELRQQQFWLERDLKRAGIVPRDENGKRLYTFHSLKRRYVVRLIEAGAKIHEVRRLARHKDSRTTLNYYTHETLSDLAKLADKLPPV